MCWVKTQLGWRASNFLLSSWTSISQWGRIYSSATYLLIEIPNSACNFVGQLRLLLKCLNICLWSYSSTKSLISLKAHTSTFWCWYFSCIWNLVWTITYTNIILLHWRPCVCKIVNRYSSCRIVTPFCCFRSTFLPGRFQNTWRETTEVTSLTSSRTIYFVRSRILSFAGSSSLTRSSIFSFFDLHFLLSEFNWFRNS